MRSPAVRLQLPPEGSLFRIGDSDPLPYYYKRLTGRLYRHRIDVGLRHLPDRCDRLLEIGYGSGLLMPTLARHCSTLTGIDIHPHAKEVASRLRQLGVAPTLVSADARRLSFTDSYFDVIVGFSFMEHVRPIQPFLEEMIRVLKPGGKIILGMPMVNKAFNRLFPLIGYHHIDHEHVTSPMDVRDELGKRGIGFVQDGIFPWLPLSLRPYTVFIITKTLE